MDNSLFNSSQGVLLDNIPETEYMPTNVSELETSTYVTRLTSPFDVTVVVLLVFLLSSMILISNSLVLISIYRFKRLRTPSNYLVMSLATSDMGVGLILPVIFYLELNSSMRVKSNQTCLSGYGIVITLCCVSVLVMVAIAVDRFTSLARPLRYNNLITHTSMERYIVMFWIYSTMVGFSPFVYSMFNGSKDSIGDCTFAEMVEKPVQLFMFCAVYGPSFIVLLLCYGYVYFVARGHARAIRSEARQQMQSHYSNTVGPPRYGLTLAITTGLFVILWMPFQICMLVDVFYETKILTRWTSIYLALPILSSSAVNPWIYGYRNSEMRAAVRRVVDNFLSTLGFTYHSHQISDRDQIPPSVAATAGDPGSFINNVVQREEFCIKSEGEYLLVPIAKPESTGILSSNASQKFCFHNSKLLLSEPSRITIKNSRSMIDSLAILSASDVLIVKGLSLNMKHGSSVL